MAKFFPLTTETEFDVLEAKLGGSSGGAFFNECQTFLLSGILAGKTAFNAIAEKIFNPELACHLSKKGSHGRKIQLDGTMVLELLYNTTAKRDPTCGNEATSLDSWLRHTYERFEAWPNKPKDYARIQILSVARQTKVRANLSQASARAAQRKKERDEELKCYEDGGGDEARAYAMTYGSKRKRKISSGGDSTDSGDDKQQKRKPENEENETQQTQLAQSAESAVGDPGNQTVLEVSTSSASANTSSSSTSKEDDHMLDEPNAVFDDLFSTIA